ncbi:MAG: ATP-binding cassette domain-containing protein [Candidatus Neomarinimicrobiota bacterium]
MVQIKRVILKVNDLEKNHGSHNVLKIKKLDIHPGTIYGIVGTVGSGKTTLLNILAGVEKETSGSVLYEDNYYQTNWLGKVIMNEDVFYTRKTKLDSPNTTVSNYVKSRVGKKKNIIQNRYFKDGGFQNLWNRNIRHLSSGELNWLGLILACESDPRVLLIDDYGAHFNDKMEKDFRNKLTSMNRTLGTTIVLSAPSDKNLKYFASVLIFLDHGHIWKIRSGLSRNMNKNKKNNKKGQINSRKRYKKKGQKR